MERVLNHTQNQLIATNVARASRLPERLRGLLGKKELPQGHGLWIDSCNSIHTFFMHFSIDVVFLNKEGRVLRILENVKPFRMTRIVFGASSVLELPAGTLKNARIQLGDILKLGGSA